MRRSPEQAPLQPKHAEPAGGRCIVSMSMASTIVGGLWIAFFCVWLVGAAFIKPAARVAWGPTVVRLGLFVAAVWFLRTELHWHPVSHLDRTGPAIDAQAFAGVAACLLGIGFAIWARLLLGRNWGVPMSLRKGHELVTGGPYRYVRHPIYSGLLLALLGTALVLGRFWLVPLAVALVSFVYAAFNEERSLRATFPERYPAYARETKMLIPFIL